MNEKYANYLGKHYVAGLQDCFSVVVSFYKDQFEVEITNYARPTGWESYPEFDFFNKLYAAEGFDCPTNNPNDLRFGDVLLMGVLSESINHCAVYLGQNKILHHLSTGFSTIDEYSYQWQRRVVKVLRHKDREAKMCRDSSSILELLPEHLQLRLARRLEDKIL